MGPVRDGGLAGGGVLADWAPEAVDWMRGAAAVEVEVRNTFSRIRTERKRDATWRNERAGIGP